VVPNFLIWSAFTFFSVDMCSCTIGVHSSGSMFGAQVIPDAVAHDEVDAQFAHLSEESRAALKQAMAERKDLVYERAVGRLLNNVFK